ncbi:MAG: DoxX family protein [Opitutus sp.]|nr:DoxX family protein [Opitutus sp.]
MKTLHSFLQLKFLPASQDAGLLVLRVWLGVSMVVLHGWVKIVNFNQMSGQFPDFLGIGPKGNLIAAIFGEFVCGLLVVIGLGTRFAALVLTIVMAFAFFAAHGAKLSGPGSGELAFIFLAGFVTLLVAGPGRFSVDGNTKTAA